MTTSPSSRGPAAGPVSSIGNESTSVGPDLPRCSAFSDAIASAATNAIATWPSSRPADASASATSRSISASGGAPAGGSRISTSSTAARRVRGPQPGRQRVRMLVVGLDDPLHEPMAHHVLTAEPDEFDAFDVLQDVRHDDQTGLLVARQVDLRDVPGDHHLRPEPEPRQEHLHLLRRRVLRLVEDHEGVVERVVGDEEVVRDVERIRGGDLDANGLGLAGGLNRFDEPHRTARAVLAIAIALASEPERLDVDRQPHVEDERIVAVMDRAPLRESRLAPLSRSAAPVGDSPKRANEEQDVVAQALGTRRVLHTTGALTLDDRSSVAVEEALQQGEPYIRAVQQVVARDELRRRGR